MVDVAATMDAEGSGHGRVVVSIGDVEKVQLALPAPHGQLTTRLVMSKLAFNPHRWISPKLWVNCVNVHTTTIDFFEMCMWSLVELLLGLNQANSILIKECKVAEEVLR